MAIHMTLRYCSLQEDRSGVPNTTFRYVIIADSGLNVGTGAASITTLAAPVNTNLSEEFDSIYSAMGGAYAALSMAEALLDRLHANLHKTTSIPTEK